MPQPPTLKISEIFPSIQGEGLRQGEPTIFVRFAGCNLRCTFCDTKYAWTDGTKINAEGKTPSDGRALPPLLGRGLKPRPTTKGATPPRIPLRAAPRDKTLGITPLVNSEGIAARVASVRKGYPASWVALTGGEPFAQNLGALIRRLRADGFHIQVETNGTIYRPWPVDWLTVSPKPRAWAYDLRFRSRASEVKLVVTKSLTLAVVARLRREFPARVPILLQPESNAAWSRARGRRLLERALRNGLGNIRLTVQLHRIYDLP